MRSFRLILAMIAMCGAMSCVRENISDGNGRIKLTLTGSINETKATDSGFNGGDEVGIYVVDYANGAAQTLKTSGNRADNIKHTYNSSTKIWEPESDIYFKDASTNVDIYGYYPYGDPNNVGSYNFEVSRDQNEESNYEISDFLWGSIKNVAPTTQAINLTFDHMMAGVKIALNEGDGFEDGEWESAAKTIVIQNTKRSATINLASGEVTPTGETPSNGIIPLEVYGLYRAVVVPQTIAAGSPLVSVSVNGYSYKLTKSEDFTYSPSKLHTFTLTVNKKESSGTLEIILDGESITDWQMDEGSHSATTRAYTVINVSEAGTLDKCIEAAGEEAEKLRYMKITGTINSRDFAIMRYQMSQLQALNLKDVTIVATEEGSSLDGTSETTYNAGGDDSIPPAALQGKTSLTSIIFPDKLAKIGSNAFAGCINLSGSLIIPEGVTVIESAAFNGCQSLTGTLSLPSTLKSIGSTSGYLAEYDATFGECQFTCELTLPEGLETIGIGAFYKCSSLYGELVLPAGLKELGERAFAYCEKMTGSIEIPEGVTMIPYGCFQHGGFNGNLILHDNVVTIGKEAFESTSLKGELVLPNKLEVLSEKVFYGCDFSGELSLPSTLRTIGNESLYGNSRLTGVIEIPEDMSSIGEYAFYGCSGLQGIIFPESIESIRTQAFANCYGIGRIVCKGEEPPYVASDAFDGVSKDNFPLEVPSSAISQYKTATGWKDFVRIAEYYNFYCRPSAISAINSSVTRTFILNSDYGWKIASKPDWVSVSPQSGEGKTEISVTFDAKEYGGGDRVDSLVFVTSNGSYSTGICLTQYDYEYAEDEMVTLQSASKGEGVNIVFLGDGYNALEVSDGTMMAEIQEAVGYFFDIEPYTTYRDYFNVYAGIAVSQESGVGGLNTIINNHFGTTFKGEGMLGGRNGESSFQDILEYACKAPTVSKSNIGETLVVMILNTYDYAGTCYMFNDGSAIAYCPKSDFGYPQDFRGTIQHDAGGHGFGKLGDESVRHNAFIDACQCLCCGHLDAFKAAKAKGWYQNLSLSGKTEDVPWANMIYHDNYKSYVDVFEGGFQHSRGVYRSEAASCMGSYIPYYNAISRKAIVQRIMMLAGEGFSFNSFVEKDKQ